MIYLFFGADELSRSEALRAAKAEIPDDLADLNIAVLDGRKLKLDALAAACESIPFLADRRLVIVEDGLKYAKAETRDAIKAYLPRVPATTDLIFVEREDVDKRLSLFSWLKKHATVREFAPKEGADLHRWIQERAASWNAQIAPDAITQLIDFVGNDSRALHNEIHKLANYVGPGGTISADAVRRLVPDNSETSIFAFVDALAARRLAPALTLLRGLLDDGEPPLKLLFMIGRQTRILVQVKELAEQRMRADAIASALKQPPFVVKKAIEQAGRFQADALLCLHDRLLELDHWSKTGRIDGVTALELLVAETCEAPRPTRGAVAR